MELILTEWIGANEKVSLSDDRILKLNTDVIYEELFNELLETPSVFPKRIPPIYKDSLEIFKNNGAKEGAWKNIYNTLKTKIERQLFEDAILKLVSSVGTTRDILRKILKGAGVDLTHQGEISREDLYNDIKDCFKEKIHEIVYNDKSIEQLIKKIGEINDRHKNVDANKNPICEIKRIGEQYFVWTYQYAAEIEVSLHNDNTLKIRIEPRNLITDEHYKKMLESVFNFQVMDHISGQKSSSFILLYLMAFLGRVEQTIQRGVYREYVDREENLHYLKERLLIADHLRENRFSPDRVYCAFSELSSDNLINHTINQTLTHIKRAYTDSGLYTRIRKIQNRISTDELSNIPISISQIKSLQYNRTNKPYEEIMGYCYNILQNIGGSFGSADNLKYSAFYVDMNELFETYVGKLLSNKDTEILGIKEIWDTVCECEKTDTSNPVTWDNYYVETQDRGRYYLAEDGGAFNQEVRPDFIIKKREDDSVAAVLDTKYKRLSDRQDLHYGIHREDIYQVITYGYRFNTDKIFLIYPKSPEYTQENLVSITIPSKEGDSKTLYIAYVDLLANSPSTS